MPTTFFQFWHARYNYRKYWRICNISENIRISSRGLIKSVYIFLKVSHSKSMNLYICDEWQHDGEHDKDEKRRTELEQHDTFQLVTNRVQKDHC